MQHLFCCEVFTAMAARKAGRQLSFASLLVTLVCELPIYFRSKRLGLGIRREMQASHRSMSVNGTWDVANDDEPLLACIVVGTSKRMLIQAKDQAFWEYYWGKGNYFNLIRNQSSIMYSRQPRSLNCKIYTQPPKAATILRKKLPEEITDLIASFDNSSLHCNACGMANFNMKFLEKCSTAETVEQFRDVQKEVKGEDGTCRPGSWSETNTGQGGKTVRHTLQSCIGLNRYVRSDNRIFAACQLERDSETQKLIGEKEVQIRRLQTSIYIRKEEKQARIGKLQTVVGERKQDTVYIKHIFEGL